MVSSRISTLSSLFISVLIRLLRCDFDKQVTEILLVAIATASEEQEQMLSRPKRVSVVCVLFCFCFGLTNTDMAPADHRFLQSKD